MKKTIKNITFFLIVLIFFASCNKNTDVKNSENSKNSQKTIKIGKANSETDFNFETNEAITEIFITGYKGKSKKIVIPETIQGLPVVGIKKLEVYNLDNLESVTQLVIPSSVKFIAKASGLGADTKNGVNIILPEGLVGIGYKAFYYAKINSINIPSTLKYIGTEAFSDAELKNINLNEGLEFIGLKSFYGSEIESLTLPSTLKFLVSGDVFGNCNNLKEINLPENLRNNCGRIYYDTYLTNWGTKEMYIRFENFLPTKGYKKMDWILPSASDKIPIWGSKISDSVELQKKLNFKLSILSKETIQPFIDSVKAYTSQDLDFGEYFFDSVLSGNPAGAVE